MTTIIIDSLSLEPEAIVEFLKQRVHLKEICHNILRQQIVQRAAQERGISVTPDEIQAEADRQRYEKRLESAAATYAWLAEQLVTPEDWETGIRNFLLADKLARHLFEQDVERYFAQNRLNFDQVILYRLVVPYQQLAQEIFYQIEEGEISFYEAAHFYDISEHRRLHCGYEGQMYRYSLKPDLAALLFSAKVREVVGPIQSEQGYDLFMVEEFISPELTPTIRQTIINRMFQEWLDSELNYLIHSNS